MKRKALLMVREAFEETASRLPFPRCGFREAAAAATETILRMRKAAEAAAAKPA